MSPFIASLIVFLATSLGAGTILFLISLSESHSRDADDYRDFFDPSQRD